MMMDCLHYLYDNQADFEELIGYMKQAMPGQYFKRGVTGYEVAHKYGSVQAYNNDVGIIYTPQPFLLAVYTQSFGVGNDGICAEAAKLLTAYTVWQGEHMPEPEPEEIPEESPEETLPEPEPEAEPPRELPAEAPPEESHSPAWLLLLLLPLGVLLYVLRAGKRRSRRSAGQ